MYLNRFFLFCFSPFLPHTARRIPCIIPFLPMISRLLFRSRRAASLFWFIPSHAHNLCGGISPASFPSWFRVPLTSLSTQNRLYSVNTSLTIWYFSIIRESVADWWFSPFLWTRHLGFPYDLPYVFLPLLTSFRSACHAHRFRSSCRHTTLYIHYKLASQHWGIATPNYGSFYRTSWGDESHTFLPLWWRYC